MIKSMTGFGRYEDANDKRKIIVEIKSVNHRYCEMTIKTPKKFNCFESAIRNLLKRYIQRGKVDVYVYYEDLGASLRSVRYNRDLAGEYVRFIRQISEDFNIDDNLKATTVARFPDVITSVEEDEQSDDLWEDLKACIEKAAEKFVETRIAEGNNLYADLNEKLNHLKELINEIEVRSPKIVEEYRNRLYDKVNELLKDTKIDEAVLATEITVFADKICVDEETVRLLSHIDTMLAAFNFDGGIGRKLDFIAQEMNREANTILSKANDITVSNYAIELKTDIEKIREQIQNIE